MERGAEVAVVTGAARGIGAATAKKFAQMGYRVVASDVLPRAEWELEEDSGVPADWRRECDVSDEDSVRRLVEESVDEWGRIDALANIAGVVLVKPLDETTWEEYRQLVDVNLGGIFLLCKHVLPVMKRQMRGAIVNMASVSGHVGQTDHALYGATKGSVIALCRALAWEAAPFNIRVNSVSPGSVDTPMLRGDIQTESERTGKPYEEVKTLREAEQAFGRCIVRDRDGSTRRLRLGGEVIGAFGPPRAKTGQPISGFGPGSSPRDLHRKR
jgi:NAD(P)-dependent dehydrogenase (short-subunit alcohol dehydrogenase family)